MRAIKLLVGLFTVNLLVVGVVIYAYAPNSSSQSLELKTVSIQRPSEDTPQLVIGKPKKLIVESAGINIDVVDGLYDPASKEWTLSNDKAHFALMTSEANNMIGNTFIYGHNRKKVFDNLDKVQVGDIAVVKTDNNKTFTYKMIHVREVSPNDVSVFEYQGRSILTVQTCSGSWYEKRQLFTFEFVEVV
jgi:LPXTG-site transpeptidase (sortase) family protein